MMTARTRRAATKKTPAHSITPRYLTPEELATMLAVKLRTITHWRSTGEGPRWTHIGRHVRYPRHEVERWCAEREQEMET